jgi:hypothetical protein
MQCGFDLSVLYMGKQIEKDCSSVPWTENEFYFTL